MNRLPQRPCRHCGRWVGWVTTVNNRPLPVNPEPDPAGNVYVSFEDGRLIGRVPHKDDTELPPGVCHMPHFATCTALPRRTKPTGD